MAEPEIQEDQPVYMTADQMGYDQKNAIVVARGKVEVIQGQSILLADQITYYQSLDLVRADGNVVVTDETGEVYFADKVQLKQAMKQGVIRNFRVRMADNSQFAAREAKKVTDNKTELTKAVYSPCKVCEGKSPFWQLKADKVEIDQAEEEVVYDDLQLEFYGVPVLYTPYFFHPTPDSGRKSGFLRPEYSQDSNLGTVIKTPYYLNIAPDKDATLTPYITSDEGPVFESEYRQRTDNGMYKFWGSITNPDERDDLGRKLPQNELRGHIYADGVQQLAPNWRAGFDIRRATDDTYLRKYDYSNERSLNSQLFLEGNYGRSYAEIQALTFQGLREEDDPDREPFVLPLAEAYLESDPGWHGSRYYTQANTQVIARNEGVQSRRLSLTNGYKIPLVTQGGQLIDVDSNVRVDGYSIENQPLTDSRVFDGEKTRALPQASMKWRYPLMKQVGGNSLIIEPTVLAVAQARGNNPEEIPNEDNAIVEYADSSLFDINPFPGYDTVDEGSRVAYGVRGQWMMDSRASLHALFGQNYSAESDTPYPYNDEPGEEFSDYVGRLGLDYRPITLSYRFRLDQEDGAINANTITARYDANPIAAQVSYLTLKDNVYFDDREEIFTALALALTDEWSISGTMRRDLLREDTLFMGTGLEFQNDCFTVLTGFSRQFARDRDFEPDTNFSVRVSFKNLNDL